MDELKQRKRIGGANWDLEMGAITELIYRERNGVTPAVLFDRIPGYPDRFRALFGMTCSVARMGLSLGLPSGKSGLELVRAYRDKLKVFTPIPPREVSEGPIFENVDRGEAVNVLKFPVPRIHELDGGRYIGTGCLVITRDPEEG